MCKKGDDGELRYAEAHDTRAEAHDRPKDCFGMLLLRQHLEVLPTPGGDGGSCESDGYPSEQLGRSSILVNVIQWTSKLTEDHTP